MGKFLDKDGLAHLGNVISDKLDTKANVDGAYELMTVGNAEQLIASTTVEDKSPYLFRTSGGSLDIGDRLNLKSIVGGSVVWNQLVKNGNFENTSEWLAGSKVQLSISNNECEVTLTSIPTYNFEGTIQQTLNSIKDHIYLSFYDIYVDKTSKVAIQYLDKLSMMVVNSGWNSVIGIDKATANYSRTRYGIVEASAYGYAIGDTYKVRKCNLIDLTVMFGSTIADYIYTLETAKAGSGIAWLKKYGYITKDYYAYSANTMQSVNVSAHNTTGFNQWDEEYEIGAYSVADGTKTSNNQRRCVNPIPIFPSTAYYCYNSLDANTSGTIALFYDKGGNFITNVDGNKNYKAIGNTTFTTPANAYYMNFYTTAIGENSLCINLHWDGSRDGEYEPYKKNSYDLSGSHEVTRKYAEVDLGDYTWSIVSGTTNLFQATIPVAAVSSNAIPANAICTKYGVLSFAVVNNQNTIGFGLASSSVATCYLRIYDTNYSDKDVFKAAMQGVKLVYEKATPTTETVTNPTLRGIPKLDANNNLYYDGDSFSDFQNLQIVDDFGTEEFVDNRDVPIPVGHLTDYYPDLRAKLEMTPNSPDGNGDYLVRQTNGINEYVEYVSPIPTPPTTDGTYALKATVSSGVATLSWVSEE